MSRLRADVAKCHQSDLLAARVAVEEVQVASYANYRTMEEAIFPVIGNLSIK